MMKSNPMLDYIHSFKADKNVLLVISTILKFDGLRTRPELLPKSVLNGAIGSGFIKNSKGRLTLTPKGNLYVEAIINYGKSVGAL